MDTLQGIERRSGPPPDVPGVGEVTARIKECVEGRFADVWVAGEVTNVVRAASGHVYLAIKDAAAVLRGIVWRGALPLLAIEPEDGLEVICHGRVEVYPPRGTYQLSIDRMHAVGTGALEAKLRRLQATLEAEGLFAPQRKRPLPPFPRRIAVVTSPAGAALHDFLQTLRGRWPAAEVIVVPSRVQGAGAAAEVAAAIARAGRLRPPVDVIALVRGGGSLEDLWAFNEEPLVRAVAMSPIPVVAGVGHEIDVTLADLAADVRALTPTDAAVRISPDRHQLLATVGTLDQRLHAGLLRRAASAREWLERLASARMLVDPSWILRDRQTIVDTHEARLQRLMAGGIERARERLAAAAGRLDAVSPLAILARGYSVTWSEADGVRAARPLISAEGLAAGTRLVTQLATGRIRSRVERVDPPDGETVGTAAGNVRGDRQRGEHDDEP
ncbi:MAG: exodeoxyribonuclease VII large subunit [Planctomycetia bacterium]